MKNNNDEPTHVWLGFIQPGDVFQWKDQQVTCTRTDREPIRNARLIYTDTGLELYVRRDDETIVHVIRREKAST